MDVGYGRHVRDSRRGLELFSLFTHRITSRIEPTSYVFACCILVLSPPSLLLRFFSPICLNISHLSLRGEEPGMAASPPLMVLLASMPPSARAFCQPGSSPATFHQRYSLILCALRMHQGHRLCYRWSQCRRCDVMAMHRRSRYIISVSYPQTVSARLCIAP